jgi:excisionase family DNA binding protein
MQADLLKFKIEDRKTMKRHRIRKEEIQMKESNYKSYDELPLFLNAATVAKVLGIAPSSSYELMHEKDFPALRIGNRIVVPKEAFIRWVEQHTGGAE